MVWNLGSVLLVTVSLYLPVTAGSGLQCRKCHYLSVDSPHTTELDWLQTEDEYCSRPEGMWGYVSCPYVSGGRLAQCRRIVSSFGGIAKSSDNVSEIHFTGRFYDLGCIESPTGSENSCSIQPVNRSRFDTIVAEKLENRRRSKEWGSYDLFAKQREDRKLYDNVAITSFESTVCRCSNDLCNSKTGIPLTCYECVYISVDSKIENSGVIQHLLPENATNNLACSLPVNPSSPGVDLSFCPISDSGKVAKCSTVVASVQTKLGFDFKYYRSSCSVVEKNSPNTCLKILHEDLKSEIKVLDDLKFEASGETCSCDTDLCNTLPALGQTTSPRGFVIYIAVFMTVSVGCLW